jgi:dTDP-4-amino-4,6-dideoxygalactose transaminase
LGVGPGDEVITAANTFIGTTEPVGLVGATPVFCDIDPVTYNLDPDKLAGVITNKTRAVIAVHLYGRPAPVDAIKRITEPRGIALVEDAAQAHGAEYNQRRIGSLGHIAGFSFYPGKNLGAYGDGGAVVTNSSDLADRVRMLRNHGRHQKYEHEMEGVNSRLDELQAAILGVKLRHLDAWNERRRYHARRYTQQLADLPIVTPVDQANGRSVYHLYVIRTPHRDALREFLKKQGISAGIHYPLPLHLQPAYKHLGYGIGDFPIAEAAAKEILSLPMYPELTESDVDRVCDSVREFLETRAE